MSSSRFDFNPGAAAAVLTLSGSLLLKGITITLQSHLVLELYCAKPGVAGMPTRWAGVVGWGAVLAAACGGKPATMPPEARWCCL